MDDCFTLQGSLIGNGGNTSQLLFQKPIQNFKQIFVGIIWACILELCNTMIRLFVRTFINNIVILIENNPHIEM